MFSRVTRRYSHGLPPFQRDMAFQISYPNVTPSPAFTSNTTEWIGKSLEDPNFMQTTRSTLVLAKDPSIASISAYRASIPYLHATGSTQIGSSLELTSDYRTTSASNAHTPRIPLLKNLKITQS